MIVESADKNDLVLGPLVKLTSGFLSQVSGILLYLMNYLANATKRISSLIHYLEHQ
jgi:hypothetical protein